MELEIGDRGFTLCNILYHSRNDITSEPAGTGSILQGEDSFVSSDDIHAVFERLDLYGNSRLYTAVV